MNDLIAVDQPTLHAAVGKETLRMRRELLWQHELLNGFSLTV